MKVVESPIETLRLPGWEVIAGGCEVEVTVRVTVGLVALPAASVTTTS